MRFPIPTTSGAGGHFAPESGAILNRNWRPFSSGKRTKKHEKLIIIDQCTLFEGSVNVLSPSPSDNIREHFDSEAVSTIIELHELWCEECDKFIPIISTSATTPERITKLGNKLAERRRALDRTARILAQNSDVSKTCLLRLEAGLNGTVSSLLKITEALDFENIQVPKYLVPAVIRVLERAKGKELDQPRPFES